VPTRAAARLAVSLAAPALSAGPAGAQVPPPHVPPLAFRTATLVRADRTIEIRLSATADVGVRVIVSRGTVRLGQAGTSLGPGNTVVPVRIGPRGIRPLRKGLHVNVAIFYGDVQPLRARPALLLGDGEPLPPTA
jgi:hypothetical protein